MRQARIKIDPAVDEAVYHCISRAVAAEWLFGDVAKEVFRRQLWKTAEFCGVEIITYAILSNHFHVTVRVPRRTPVSDAELLRRYHLLHPRLNQYQRNCLAAVRSQMPQNGPEAVKWRRQQLALMNDVSPFMKLWKQRFSRWFNQHHHRIGTLWASRFTSYLVEPRGFAVQTVAAYVDLNAVRAGLVIDPKDYRWCGYAEAVAGHPRARAGLASIYGMTNWREVREQYRTLLFGIGAEPREHRAAIPREEFQRVIREKGKLPLADLLRCRLRYLGDGGILGSREFVETQLAAYRRKVGPRPRTAPRRLPSWWDYGELYTMRALRGSTVG